MSHRMRSLDLLDNSIIQHWAALAFLMFSEVPGERKKKSLTYNNMCSIIKHIWRDVQIYAYVYAFCVSSSDCESAFAVTTLTYHNKTRLIYLISNKPGWSYCVKVDFHHWRWLYFGVELRWDIHGTNGFSQISIDHWKGTTSSEQTLSVNLSFPLETPVMVHRPLLVATLIDD